MEEKVDERLTLEKELDVSLTHFVSNYEVIVIISDKTCLGCNKKVVKITSKLMPSEENLGVVLETMGTRFDISPLLKEEIATKVFSDHKLQLSKKYKMSNTFILRKNNSSSVGYSTTAINEQNQDQFEKLLLENLNKTKEAS